MCQTRFALCKMICADIQNDDGDTAVFQGCAAKALAVLLNPLTFLLSSQEALSGGL